MNDKQPRFERISIDPRRGWKDHTGDHVVIQDTDTGKVYYGRIRLKEVTCGKSNCTKCPHHIYAYAQFRVGKKVTEKYLGVAR